MRLLKNKKGIEVWISWVLLMGFVATLSLLMYDFIKDYTQETVDELRGRVYDTEECNSVAISIDSVCKQTATSPIYLNITVTNRLNINIDQLMFRTFDSSDRFLNISRLNISTATVALRPQQSKKITMNISSDDINTVQVIPAVFREDLVIVCMRKIVEETQVIEC